MRIVFFGASHGFSEPDRKCSCILVEVGGKRYFVDMGTDATEGLAARNIPVESVAGVFVTHMHGDHTNGLIPFLYACSWYYTKAQPQVFLPDDPQQPLSAMEAWMRCCGVQMRQFQVSQVREGLFFDDGTLKVTAYPTRHMAPSFAFVMEAEGKRVLFTGDLTAEGGPASDFPVAALDKPLDLAVCEAAHFKATAYLPYFKDNANIKQVCFNHYCDPQLASVLEMTKLLPHIPVFRAHDGTEIVL